MAALKRSPPRSTSRWERGAFVARYRPEEAGVYRATAEVRRAGAPSLTSTGSSLVGGADAEMTDPRLNLHVLQRLATASGGRLIEPGQAAVLVEQLRTALPAATSSSGAIYGTTAGPLR